MFEHIEPLVKLDEKDKIKFDKFIQDTRKSIVSPPKETTKKVVQLEPNTFKTLLDNGEISKCISILRELSYDEFLKEEAVFNGIILAQIGKIFEMPKLLLQEIASELHTFSSLSRDDFFTKTSYFFGEYAGAISPYIYHLNLSNTQSRRSRAGKTFEGIIYFLYEYFNYSYDAQSTIGKKSFSTLNLGKVVDSILPGKQAFIDCRTKTIVGSMKTTLRERWQEVVEEISRSN
ncbi:MAG: hypothetical protein JXQ76_12995, partial [Campylobacterales bacterium]|nr:hypothetical protein [Campylobacterales bacterium]